MKEDLIGNKKHKCKLNISNKRHNFSNRVKIQKIHLKVTEKYLKQKISGCLAGSVCKA